jgi:hypothetical protein
MYPENVTNLIFANSLLILFSSSSLALAFLKSAINCTSPRIWELFPELARPKNPAAAEVAMLEAVAVHRQWIVYTLVIVSE